MNCGGEPTDYQERLNCTGLSFGTKSSVKGYHKEESCTKWVMSPFLPLREKLRKEMKDEEGWKIFLDD